MHKLLFIMAHPDNAEIWCGGLIQNELKEKAEIFVITLFGNDSTRIAEAESCAKKAGYEFKYLGTDPDRLFNSIIDFKPSQIITHWQKDSNNEHRQVFELVDSLIPELIFSSNVNFNYHCCEPYNLIGKLPSDVFGPSEYIDVSEVYDQKLGMISNFKSQNVDYWTNMIKTQNKLNGGRVGVRYAESYSQMEVLGVVRCAKKTLG